MNLSDACVKTNATSSSDSAMNSAFRIEHDCLGELPIPAEALHGIHTQRALENFLLARRSVHPELARAYGEVKSACARTNRALGAWADDAAKADAIDRACYELAHGDLGGLVIVDALQGGAGTSTNMNVNEVLANRALEILGLPPGSYDRVSPLDDLNLHQSTNDTYPTALRLAGIRLLQTLEKKVVALQEAFQAAEKKFAHVVKVGRTQLQDAVLTTLGREMSAYAEAINRDRWRIYKCEERLRVVNLGGTAIGTGLAAPRQYIFQVVDQLREITAVMMACLTQIALLILQKAERYSVQLTAKKKADGTTEKLFVCALDETPWTSEDEAVAHVLKNHFATFYQAERTATEPPKGVYTFVAQCGLSGVILGPPNHHDYQNQLRKLHAEKFSRMPFDMFKSRVKIVKDEAVVKKWIEEQSFKTEYACLNVPEPLQLPTMEEVEKHFRATHKDSIIKAVETMTVAGAPSRTLRCAGLQQLIRQAWEQQRFFPLPIATKLSQQFTQHGLQFFKVNKTVTHVSVARPLFLDIESNPVSDGIRRIVEFINNTPKCTRKKLIEALAPTPKATVIPIAKTPAPAAPVAEGEVDAAAPAKPTEPQAPEPTQEQTLVLVDLHWLIHAGAVLEFADGRMETAKKPISKPSKPEKKTDIKPAEGETVSSTETVTPAEIATSTETVTPLPEAPATASEPGAEAPVTAEATPAPETPAA